MDGGRRRETHIFFTLFRSGCPLSEACCLPASDGLQWWPYFPICQTNQDCSKETFIPGLSSSPLLSYQVLEYYWVFHLKLSSLLEDTKQPCPQALWMSNFHARIIMREKDEKTKTREWRRAIRRQKKVRGVLWIRCLFLENCFLPSGEAFAKLYHEIEAQNVEGVEEKMNSNWSGVSEKAFWRRCSFIWAWKGRCDFRRWERCFLAVGSP